MITEMAVACCDYYGCDAVEVFESETPYGVILDRIKAKGWKSIDGKHYCPIWYHPEQKPFLTGGTKL